MNKNGVIYYKLEDRYDGDITKYCGLTGGEVDSNIFFLRGQDIENVKWDDENEELVFTRVNGEIIRIEGINNPVTADKTYYDPESGVLHLTLNGTTFDIKGFYVREASSGMTYSNSTIKGSGTIDNPISVSNTLRTGFFAPVERLIDLTEEGASLPIDAPHGSRFITKENLNDYGLLYNFEGVKRVKEILLDDSSKWRIPTHEDWSNMLNALEDENEFRNHLSYTSNTNNGKRAGSLLKKGTYLWELVKIEGTSQVSNGAIKPLHNTLPYPTHVEYTDTLNNDIYYEIEKDEDGVIVYEQYACRDIWKESPYTTPSYEVKESYNFKVVPVGSADQITYNYKEYFGKHAGFWSISEDNESDVWSRHFFFDKDTVKLQGEGRETYLSLRLIRDYEDNLSEVEIINGIPYETVLMPSAIVDEHGNIIKKTHKVWTSVNVSFNELLSEKHDNRPLALHVKDENGKTKEHIVYFINFWNGSSWEKQVLNNNEMIIIGTGPDGSKDEEWQLMNGTFVKRSQEIITSINAHTSKLVEDLVIEHDKDVVEIINKHDNDIKSLTNSLNNEVQERVDGDNLLLSKMEEEKSQLISIIAQETSDRKTSDEAITDLFEGLINTESLAREHLEESLRKEIEDRDADINKTISILTESFNSSLISEKSERLNSDEALQSNINNEKIERETAVANLRSYVDGEIAARKDSDSEIADRLDNESNERQNADAQLQMHLNEERNARISEDANLNALIIKNNIVDIVSPERSTNASFEQKNDGTTITIDVALDSTCEFLSYDDGGLTDKGIRNFVKSSIDELGEVVAENNEKHITDVKALDAKIIAVDNSRLEDFNLLNTKIEKTTSDALINDNLIYAKIEETKAFFNSKIDDINKSNANADAIIYQKIEENNNARINSDNTLDLKIAASEAKIEQNKSIAENNLSAKVGEINATIIAETNRALTAENVLSERIGVGYVGESITNKLNTFSNTTNEKIQNIITDVTENTDSINELNVRLNAFFNDAEISVNAIDTLKEIQNYITTDGEVASNIISNIEKAQEDINDAQSKIGVLETTVASNKIDIEHKLEVSTITLENKINNIEGDYLKGEDKEALSTFINNEVDKLKSANNNIIENCRNNDVVTKQKIDALTLELNEKHTNVVSNLSSLERTVQSNKTILEERIEDIYEELLNSGNSNNTNTNNIINEIKNSLEASDAAISANLDIEINTRQNEIARLEKEIENAQNAAESFATNLNNTIEVRVGAIENDVKALKEIDHDAYKSADEVLEAKLQSNIDAKADASVLNNYLPRSEKYDDTEVRNLISAETEVRGELETTLREEISKAQSAAEKVATNYDTAMDGRMTTVEGDVAALKEIDHDAYIAADEVLESKLQSNIDAKADVSALENYLLKSEKYDDTEVRGLISAETEAREQAVERLEELISKEGQERESEITEIREYIEDKLVSGGDGTIIDTSKYVTKEEYNKKVEELEFLISSLRLRLNSLEFELNMNNITKNNFVDYAKEVIQPKNEDITITIENNKLMIGIDELYNIAERDSKYDIYGDECWGDTGCYLDVYYGCVCETDYDYVG